MFIVALENPQPPALNDSPVCYYKFFLKLMQFQIKGLPSSKSSMIIYT